MFARNLMFCPVREIRENIRMISQYLASTKSSEFSVFFADDEKPTHPATLSAALMMAFLIGFSVKADILLAAPMFSTYWSCPLLFPTCLSPVSTLLLNLGTWPSTLTARVTPQPGWKTLCCQRKKYFN